LEFGIVNYVWKILLRYERKENGTNNIFSHLSNFLDIATFLVVITILESASAQICAIGTYAGVGSSDVGYFSGDKGDALSAKMSLEVYGGVSVDTSMKMFIGDYTNNRVRVVNPDTKIIDTIAG
jgi:hypothetical protein